MCAFVEGCGGWFMSGVGVGFLQNGGCFLSLLSVFTNTHKHHTVEYELVPAEEEEEEGEEEEEEEEGG